MHDMSLTTHTVCHILTAAPLVFTDSTDSSPHQSPDSSRDRPRLPLVAVTLTRHISGARVLKNAQNHGRVFPLRTYFGSHAWTKSAGAKRPLLRFGTRSVGLHLAHELRAEPWQHQGLCFKSIPIRSNRRSQYVFEANNTKLYRISNRLLPTRIKEYLVSNYG